MVGRAEAGTSTASITKSETGTKVRAKVRAGAKPKFIGMATTSAAASPVRKAQSIVDAKLRDRFLVALRDCGAVGTAAKQVGSNRFAMFRAREHNPDFAAAWDLSLGRVPIPAIDAAKLEAALFKRLLRGVKRNRLFQGEVADIYRVYEDRLAFAMLGRLMPDKYGAQAAGFAPEPVEVMSREEFMVAIKARPRTSELPPLDQFSQ